MGSGNYLIFVPLLMTALAQPDCNVLDPACRAEFDKQNRNRGGAPVDEALLRNQKGQCEYPKLWLIPGNADTTCTRPGVPRVLAIDTTSVVITPKIVKIPGCFEVAFNVTIYPSAFDLADSYFGKVKYQWWNLKEFADLECQNATANGCGGYGNNCYYCDLCNALNALNKDEVDLDKLGEEETKLVEQFKGVECPKKAGTYKMTRRFCFNDWSTFDKNQDCKLDFIQGAGLSNDYQSQLQALAQIGYGTLVAKLSLAHNATNDQIRRKLVKEAEIVQNTEKSLVDARADWGNISDEQFEAFKEWYTKFQLDSWHKNSYLPWLVYENEVACLKVTFDVCDKQPTPIDIPPRFRSQYNGPTMKCA